MAFILLVLYSIIGYCYTQQCQNQVSYTNIINCSDIIARIAYNCSEEIYGFAFAFVVKPMIRHEVSRKYANFPIFNGFWLELVLNNITTAISNIENALR